MSEYRVGDRAIVTGYIDSCIYDISGAELPLFMTEANQRYCDGLFANALGKTPEQRGYCRLIHRYESAPIQCIVLGWTTRKTGRVDSWIEGADEFGDGGYELRELSVSDTIKCWMVMPLDEYDSSRYRKPFAALAEQMRPVDEAEPA